MDTNIVALILSFVFLGGVIAVGIIAQRLFSLSGESMRKIIHIGVSNWWFILLFGFDRLSFALVGPILFILLNGIFTVGNWATRLGFGSRSRNWGLIYYPVSLLILVIAQYKGFLHPVSTTAAVLVMGYGDGFAALIGGKWGKREIPFQVSKKSYLGSATMFAITFLIIVFSLLRYSPLSVVGALLSSVILAAVITAIEVITPFGLDNLTVPFVTALLVEVLL